MNNGSSSMPGRQSEHIHNCAVGKKLNMGYLLYLPEKQNWHQVPEYGE